MSNIPLGGRGALRRDTEQGSEFADRQRAGAHFRSHPCQCGVPGSPHSVVDYFEASHEHDREHGICTQAGRPSPPTVPHAVERRRGEQAHPRRRSVGRRCRSRCDPAAGVDACQKRTLIWQAVWPRRQRLAFLGPDRRPRLPCAEPGTVSTAPPRAEVTTRS